MRNLYRIPLLLGMILAILLLSACYDDKPPDDGTPWPDNLNGAFLSGEDSLVFNGDGISIVLNISEQTAQSTGLPEGRSEGSYVFLIQQGSWRYDLAETFRIILDGTNYNFSNRHGETNSSLIAFSARDGQVYYFEK